MRDKRITIRFTDDEFALIEEAAKESNLPKSTVAYLLVLASVNHKKFMKEMEKIRERNEHYKSFLYQILKLGVNINQIARMLNSLGKVKLKKKLKQELEQLVEETKEVIDGFLKESKK